MALVTFLKVKSQTFSSSSWIVIEKALGRHSLLSLKVALKSAAQCWLVMVSPRYIPVSDLLFRGHGLINQTIPLTTA